MPVALLNKHSCLAAVLVATILCFLFFTAPTVTAQQPKPSAPSASTPATASQSLPSALGLHIYPASNQTSSQQSADESHCLSWAKEQTGIDPQLLVQGEPHNSEQQQAQQTDKSSSKGAGAKGAVGGAGAGAAVGAVAGDAGTGAAIGATAGAIKGRRQGRKAEKKAEEQGKQAQAQQLADRKKTYNNAFSACMEGRGYSVK
jgi:outer membrane protein with glycine zipper